jgi:hypothetical protein
MKKLLLLLTLCCNSIYADHPALFNEIFKEMKVRDFLQFGVDDSTKYFLDSCNKVFSVEFVTNGCGPDGIKRCLDLYRKYSNWVPIVYFTGYSGETNWAPYKYLGSEAIYKAISYHCATHKHYASIDDLYLHELKSFIGNLARYHKIDIAYVGTTAYIHGDLVQILFDKVPVIVANNTGCRTGGDDLYGYSRVATPDDYEEIAFDGVTVWVKQKEELQALAERLRTETRGF